MYTKYLLVEQKKKMLFVASQLSFDNSVAALDLYLFGIIPAF